MTLETRNIAATPDAIAPDGSEVRLLGALSRGSMAAFRLYFQFRCDGGEPLEAVAVTMPPWPGAEEAFVVSGIWEPTV